MKNFKLVVALFGMAVLSACGSGQNAQVASLNPYTNPSTFPGTNNVNGTQTGAYTYSVPGGTKQLIPVVYGSVMLPGTKVFSQTASVQVNDQIIVMAQGASVFASNGWYNASGYLSVLNVKINGSLVGSSLYTVYNVNQTGTLSLSADWNLIQIWGTGQMNFQVNFGNGGVYIGRCTNTSGASMPCPAGY